jgi:geranylgeranyl diphosphate synthase type II
MIASARIERALEAAFASAQGPGCPRPLAAAMSYAVFPRGARIRPRLTLAVAAACGEDRPALVEAAAAAIELIHCASLVHDDLPCFDAALLRRGKPSVHKTFGERIAVLAGDGLIVLAFQVLAEGAGNPQRRGLMALTLARSVGLPHGIAAGQAWECEPVVDVATYHRQKTGALFAGAAMMGAAACGAEPDPWRVLGETLGQAYQAADDIGDATSDMQTLGKPVGRDLMLGRPSLVAEYGIGGALRHFDDLVETAMASVPSCAGAGALKALIGTESRRLLPKDLSQCAA